MCIRDSICTGGSLWHQLNLSGIHGGSSEGEASYGTHGNYKQNNLKNPVALNGPEPVSYTHLDVYKRQSQDHTTYCR